MKFFLICLFVVLLLAVDIYFFQALKSIFKTKKKAIKWSKSIYWGVNSAGYFMLMALMLIPFGFSVSRDLVRLFGNFLIATYMSKLTGSIFLLLDDARRRVLKLFRKKEKKGESAVVEKVAGNKISRSEFLSKAALATAAIPFSTYGFGIVSGAHDYRVRKAQVFLPNLPRKFDGLRIAQLSDIHTGSFFNKTAVRGGVDLLLSQKPDVVFFTGDLVNEETKEVRDYIDVFSKVKAPLGVYSTLGNHDYGDYKRWSSPRAKRRNMEDMYEAHRSLGWDLLRDENRLLTVGGESISVIGVENWGTGRFPKYGHLSKALEGTSEVPVKLLLSHDPSHWDAQVRPQSDIDIQFAGHTHGFQLGIEIGDFKWSPAQLRYKQWAGLYSESGQHLYVNRGFGYLGYPGRIGILPEITVLELKKS
ncbi:MAG: metallophosphoesterase [Cytophagales bacterium]|nr:metallophosphoesterase [Cytophagales bacterium]